MAYKKPRSSSETEAVRVNKNVMCLREMKNILILLAAYFTFSSTLLASDEEYNKAVHLLQNRHFDQAYEILTRLAEGGDRDAQNNLGSMYLNGAGIPKNNKKAAYWYLKSARQGNVIAQYNLSIQLFNGTGLQKNKVEGYAWALMAVWGELDKAIDLSKIMEKKMTEAEKKNGLTRLFEINNEYGLLNKDPPSYFEIR